MSNTNYNKNVAQTERREQYVSERGNGMRLEMIELTTNKFSRLSAARERERERKSLTVFVLKNAPNIINAFSSCIFYQFPPLT